MQLIKEHLAAVISAHRGTVDWAWLEEWLWFAWAISTLKKKFKHRQGFFHQKIFSQNPCVQRKATTTTTTILASCLILSQILDFNIRSAAKAHLKVNYTITNLLYLFQAQVAKIITKKLAHNSGHKKFVVDIGINTTFSFRKTQSWQFTTLSLSIVELFGKAMLTPAIMWLLVENSNLTF